MALNQFYIEKTEKCDVLLCSAALSRYFVAAPFSMIPGVSIYVYPFRHLLVSGPSEIYRRALHLPKEEKKNGVLIL